MNKFENSNEQKSVLIYVILWTLASQTNALKPLRYTAPPSELF